MVILAARAQHVAQVVRPGLDRGEVVISDRYADASLAYQGGARGLGIEWVAEVNAFATSGLAPDLTILCDLPVERGMERVAHRRQGGGDFNRFDQEARTFYEAVRAAYLEIAAADPDRFVVLDADREKESVAQDLLLRVLPALEARRRAGGLAAG
jgi:dTMP kinase